MGRNEVVRVYSRGRYSGGRNEVVRVYIMGGDIVGERGSESIIYGEE